MTSSKPASIVSLEEYDVPFTDVANDLLIISEKRSEIFYDEFNALGDDTWQVLLKLYVNRHSKIVVLRTTLKSVMRFPQNLDRILSVLLNRNLVIPDLSKTGGDQTFKITEEAVSKIHLVLDSALGAVTAKV